MKISELKNDMDERFAQVDERFAQIDERFAQIDERFAQIDERFAQIDERFAQVDERFARIEERITEEGQITRRHFDVVAESLTREIRLVAATVAEGQKRLDENRSEHQTFIGALNDHELRLRVIEQRGSA